MIEWLTFTQLGIALAAGVTNLLFGALGKPPKTLNLSLLGLVEVALLGQLIATVVVLASGAAPKQNVFEFFGYLLVAILLPLGATFWSTIERNRFSTIVLGVVPLVIAVMLLRMTQLWG